MPSLQTQQQIIDIIEPIEVLENNLFSLIVNIESFIKNVDSNDGFIFGEFVSTIKKQPKNIKQASAKILSRRTTLMNQLEEPSTYLTNNFFAPKGTLLINTIRSYLEKFGLLNSDADVNGTLAMFEMSNVTSAIHNLLNDEFWEQANLMSHGTKMPVIKIKDILKIKARKTEIEIEDLSEIFITLSTLKASVKKLKSKLINVLVK